MTVKLHTILPTVIFYFWK